MKGKASREREEKVLDKKVLDKKVLDKKVLDKKVSHQGSPSPRVPQYDLFVFTRF